MKRQVLPHRTYWEGRADDYIVKHPPGRTPSNLQVIKKLVDKYDPVSVVDGGCGLGAYFDAFSGRRVIGIEQIDKMAAEAKRRFPWTQIIAGDLMNLRNLAPDRYGMFFTYTALEHIKDDDHVGEIIRQATEHCDTAVICEPIENFTPSDYCFHHDYVRMFADRGWRLVEDVKLGRKAHALVFQDSNVVVLYSWCEWFAREIRRQIGVVCHRYDSDRIKSRNQSVPKYFDHLIVFPPVEYVVGSIAKRRRPHQRIYYYFLGTEVKYLETGKYNIEPYLQNPATVICEYSEMKNRLEALGFKGIFVVPLPIKFFDVPMPEVFTVGVYAKDREILDYDKTIDVVRHCPDVRFLVYGPESTKLLPHLCRYGNVIDANPDTCFGLQLRKTAVGYKVANMPKLMKNVSCLLRLTHSDGLSVSVLEYLAAGKRVVWNHKLDYGNEFMLHTDDVDSISAALNVWNRRYDGSVDDGQKNDIRKWYSRSKFLERLGEVLK